jgi:hypothetical protein
LEEQIQGYEAVNFLIRRLQKESGLCASG